MALEATGRLIQIMPEQTGTGKNGVWVKQDIVIETQEQFPKKICLSLWGDKVAQSKQYQLGQVLKITAAVESREYNGKWYTDVKPFRIDADGATQGEPNYNNTAPNEIDLIPDPSSDIMNDLPF